VDSKFQLRDARSTEGAVRWAGCFDDNREVLDYPPDIIERFAEGAPAWMKLPRRRLIGHISQVP